MGRGKPALSLDERVSRDGAFSSRRGTREGIVSLRERIAPLMLPFITGLPLTIARLPAVAPALLAAAAQYPSRPADLLRPFLTNSAPTTA
jgi:DNA primase